MNLDWALDLKKLSYKSHFLTNEESICQMLLLNQCYLSYDQYCGYIGKCPILKRDMLKYLEVKCYDVGNLLFKQFRKKVHVCLQTEKDKDINLIEFSTKYQTIPFLVFLFHQRSVKMKYRGRTITILHQSISFLMDK